MALGSWRFFLAFLVAISHLWGGMIHGPAAYAVWGFFLISGYLMTLGMSTRYADGWAGLRDYAINRFLRIYPSYYVACVLGLVALLWLPQYGVNPAVLNADFVLPQHWRDWATNALLLPLWGAGNLLVPVSSALGVEVGAYLLVPLMARSPAAPWIALILSGLLNLQHGIEPQTFTVRYSMFLTIIMAFAAGSLIAHYRDYLHRWRSPWLSSVAWLAHCLIWLKWDTWPWTWGLYLSLLLTAWVLISFVDRKTGPIDRWLGDLSYPVYLFHTVMAVWFLGVFEHQRTLSLFLLGIAGTLLVSSCVIVWVDRPLERRFKRRRAIPRGEDGSEFERVSV
jgi:peptidoglycan/LPS O-acetylase OafA/YrhL